MDIDEPLAEMYLFPDVALNPQAENVFLEFCVNVEMIDDFEKEGEKFNLRSCIINKADNGIFLNALNALADRINALGLGKELNEFSVKLYQQLEEEFGEPKYH